VEHSKEKHLIIRADVSPQIGTGHLMRCLALAQAWKDDGGKVIFITACQGEGLLQRLREEEFDIHLLARPHPDAGDWDRTKDILAAYPGAWVVLDGYHFDGVYQQWVKEAGHQLLVIDDMAHLRHYYADIVLNQNLSAERLYYSTESYTQLLLGTRYVLLRREFLAWKNWKREIPEVARYVLVTLGGSDPDNLTLKVIQALQEVKAPDLEVRVVVGASNPHAGELERVAGQCPIPIRLIHDAQNISELMAWADVAISSAGSTVWELLFLGTPTLVVILAANQRQIAEVVERQGVGGNLGRAENLSIQSLAESLILIANDSNWRRKISRSAQQVADGQGTQRVMPFL
jgi:UDP-2,4-diacetamido-2,4,6-trideoxy-beta-L-altropyranose hydrolase